jgi:tetratricopeptide (TPR) repeat protein
MYERTLGVDHPDVGVLAHNLAMLHHMQNKYMEAEPLYKKAMTIRTKALGSKHPEVMRLLLSYADLLEKTHRQAEAEHLKQCIDGVSTGRWTRSGRWTVFSTTSKAADIAPATAPVTGKGAESAAIAMAQIRKMAGQAKPQGSQPAMPPGSNTATPDPQISQAEGDLARFKAMHAQGEETQQLEAVPLREVKTLRPPQAPEPRPAAPLPHLAPQPQPIRLPQPQSAQSSLPPRQQPRSSDHDGTHANSWTSFRTFAEQSTRENNFIVAEQLWRNALLEAEHLGPLDPRLALTLDALSEVLAKQQKYDAAEVFTRRAIDIKVNAVGRNHVAVAHSTSALAKLFYSKGEYKQAVSLAKECIRIYEIVAGPDHPDTACAVYNLALIYHFKNAIHDAEKAYQRALHIRQKSLGDKHPDTVKAQNNFNKLLALKQKDQERSNDKMLISGTWRVLEMPPDAQLWLTEAE